MAGPAKRKTRAAPGLTPFMIRAGGDGCGGGAGIERDAEQQHEEHGSQPAPQVGGHDRLRHQGGDQPGQEDAQQKPACQIPPPDEVANSENKYILKV